MCSVAAFAMDDRCSHHGALMRQRSCPCLLAMRRIWMHLLQSRGQQSILAARGHLTPPCSAWMQTGNYVSVLLLLCTSLPPAWPCRWLWLAHANEVLVTLDVRLPTALQVLQVLVSAMGLLIITRLSNLTACTTAIRLALLLPTLVICDL